MVGVEWIGVWMSPEVPSLFFCSITDGWIILYDERWK